MAAICVAAPLALANQLPLLRLYRVAGYGYLLVSSAIEESDIYLYLYAKDSINGKTTSVILKHYTSVVIRQLDNMLHRVYAWHDKYLNIRKLQCNTLVWKLKQPDKMPDLYSTWSSSIFLHYLLEIQLLNFILIFVVIENLNANRTLYYVVSECYRSLIWFRQSPWVRHFSSLLCHLLSGKS